MKQRFAILLGFAVLLSHVGGCVCNNSTITSATSDAEIDRVIGATFSDRMDRVERLLSVFDLIDPEHILLGVLENEQSNTVLIMLTKPGCHRWPLQSDSTLKLDFDDQGNLISHTRWSNADTTRSLSLNENKDETTQVERKRNYTLIENGTRTEYRRVYQSELLGE